MKNKNNNTYYTLIQPLPLLETGDRYIDLRTIKAVFTDHKTARETQQEILTKLEQYLLLETVKNPQYAITATSHTTGAYLLLNLTQTKTQAERAVKLLKKVLNNAHFLIEPVNSVTLQAFFITGGNNENQ